MKKVKSENSIIIVIILFTLVTISSIMSMGSIAAAIGNVTNTYQYATNYVLNKTWGSHGMGEGQFIRPHDLDFSPLEDKLYVVDRDNNRVQVFDKSGNFLFKWGSFGGGDGQFGLPYGLDVDARGDVWVADRNNSRVQKFDANGNFLLKFGSFGSGPGEFDNLRHVAVDEALKYVYVADSNNHRIQKFDTNGTYVKSFGSGAGTGQFSLPTTVVIDSRGDLYINERGNERIQKLDGEGNTILMWGSKGSGRNQFCHMEHLGIDKFDNIYVTDPQSDPGCSHKPAIKKYDKNGNFIAEWPVAGKGTDVDPEHLAIDLQGNIYVSERSADQIQVYSPVEK